MDLSFGIQGTVITDFAIALSVAIDQNNNIVLAGVQSGEFYISAYTVARFLPTGSPDISFGTQGTGIIVTTFSSNAQYSQANSVVIDQQNHIIVAGFDINPSSPSYFSYGLAKYLPNGTLDNTFGDSGVVVTTFSQNNNSSSLQIASSVAIDQTNNIIVAGIDYNINDPNYALAKYTNSADLVAQHNGSGAVYSILGNKISN